MILMYTCIMFTYVFTVCGHIIQKKIERRIGKSKWTSSCPWLDFGSLQRVAHEREEAGQVWAQEVRETDRWRRSADGPDEQKRKDTNQTTRIKNTCGILFLFGGGKNLGPTNWDPSRRDWNVHKIEQKIWVGRPSWGH